MSCILSNQSVLDIASKMSAPFEKQKRPKVGVGVIVVSRDHPGCVLFGKRKGNAPGEGQFQLPGGHLEFGGRCYNPTEQPKLLRDSLTADNMSEGHLIQVKKQSVTCGEVRYTGTPVRLCERESWEDCAYRECLEETGLRLKNLKYCTVVNGVELENDYHYITLFVQGEVDSGNGYQTEPQNLEPEKCEGWEWRDWDNFPQAEKLFCSLRVLKQQGYQLS